MNTAAVVAPPAIEVTVSDIAQKAASSLVQGVTDAANGLGANINNIGSTNSMTESVPRSPFEKAKMAAKKHTK